MTPIVTYFYTVLLSSLPLAPTTVFLITRQFSDDISGMTVVLPTIVLTILCIPGQRLLIPQNTTILSFLFLTFSLPLIIREGFGYFVVINLLLYFPPILQSPSPSKPPSRFSMMISPL